MMNDQQCVLPSPAKLNLFLHVLGRREDGYHQLQTVFQFIDFYDVLTFNLRKDNQIKLSTNLKDLNTEDNLIYKAAKKLQSQTNCRFGADITLNKRLPVGAGLGGGSSNAATTLLALNKLWNCQLNGEDLSELGLSLGADVPVFIHGHAAWGEGIGEQLTSMILPEYWYLLLIPPCQVNTAKIFEDSRLTRGSEPLRITAYHYGVGHNDLEAVVRMEYPEVSQALDWLGHHAKPRMTGSGGVVFAEFDTREEASRIADLAPALFKTVVAMGLNQSPLHAALVRC